jgi:3-oxoacyl-[acyl-carrier-protein] synthase III
MPNSIITRTGSYIPSLRVPNEHFLKHSFYHSSGEPLVNPNASIIEKFREITCIEERRYVPDDLNTSDMAFLAAESAIEGVEREDLDYIIVAHNFGDVSASNLASDMVPTIAARVKHKLGIKNPYTVAYDVPFGCPGWIHGMIQANYFIKSGDAKKILVIGAETLSRVSDPHDRDSMIYSDGAGATLVEATERETGVIAHVTRSDTFKDAYLLWVGKSYAPSVNGNGHRRYLKMHGHEIFKYAVRIVPEVVKRCLEKAHLTLNDVSKILIHQANQKMDEAILRRLFKIYNRKEIPDNIMPMTISWLGNSSVATLPTLYDLLSRGSLREHEIQPGDLLVFASVGAGMNVNAMVYRVP